MLKDDGVITPEEFEKIQKWLGEHRGFGPCPSCGTADWIVNGTLMTVPGFDGSGIMIGGRHMPFVCLICKYCGHTKFFNALVMKLIDRPSDEGAVDG